MRGCRIVAPSAAFTLSLGAAVLSVFTTVACGGTKPTQHETSSQAVGEQGGLRVQNPALVSFEGSWLSFSSGMPSGAVGIGRCDGTAWPNGVPHMPYRRGPTPGQLDDCYEADAAPHGPGTWASATPTSTDGTIQSPTLTFTPILAGTPSWVLVYSALKKNTTQRCLGYALNGAAPTSFPNQGIPVHSADPLYCPTNGASVSDPEFFQDGGKVYLLWRENTSAAGCESKLFIQELRTTDFTLVGTKRELLAANDGTPGTLGFDEYNVSAAGQCPSTLRQIIDSPAMVRANNGVPPTIGGPPAVPGELWLFFGANDRNSTNYATGWAKCGNGVPTAGTRCTIVSPLTDAADSAGRNRPLWGALTRTGTNPQPYLRFQDLPGFGGLSVTTTPTLLSSPTRPAIPGQVYATAQHLVSGVPRQLVFRVDDRGKAPALRETETLTWHGQAGSFFGDGQPRTMNTSGQRLTTRPWFNSIDGFTWSKGHGGLFNAIANDGTFFVGADNPIGNAMVVTGSDALVGSYNQKNGVWTRINLVTTGDFKSVPWVERNGNGIFDNPDDGGGAAVVDVETIDDGNAIAFTIGFPFPVGYEGRTPPTQGIWPAFGILTKQADGSWNVARGGGWPSAGGWINQWTGGQLSRSNLPISATACPVDKVRYLGIYQTPGKEESICRSFNEMAQFPQSKHIVIAQAIGFDGEPAVPGHSSLGLTVLGYTKDAPTGRYNVQVKGFYRFPLVPDYTRMTPGGQIPSLNMNVQPKEVQADPTGTFGDERFTLAVDLTNFADRFKIMPIVIEFSYNANDGMIRPVSAPIFPGARDHATRLCDERTASNIGCKGYGTATYDRQGNLWAIGDRVGMYTKNGGRNWSPTCAFSSSTPLSAYVTADTATNTVVWGRRCPPTFDFRDAADVSKSLGDFGGMQISPDRHANRVVLAHTAGASNIIPISWFPTLPSGAPTFRTGNVIDSNYHMLKWSTGFASDTRPAMFDKLGTMWFAMKSATIDRSLAYGQVHNWVASTDMNRLFDPDPLVLTTVLNATTTLQVENTNTSETVTTSAVGCPGGGACVVQRVAYMRRCAPLNCTAMEMPSTSFVQPLTYKVWVPISGFYSFSYSTWGAGTVLLQVDSAGELSTTVPGNTGYQEVAGPARILLSKGMHELRIRTGTASLWWLDKLTLKRVP
jgi:hypothetical protein